MLGDAAVAFLSSGFPRCPLCMLFHARRGANREKEQVRGTARGMVRGERRSMTHPQRSSVCLFFVHTLAVQSMQKPQDTNDTSKYERRESLPPHPEDKKSKTRTERSEAEEGAIRAYHRYTVVLLRTAVSATHSSTVVDCSTSATAVINAVLHSAVRMQQLHRSCASA